MNVYILKTGVANIASVTAAFERLGATVVLTSDPQTVAGAAAVVLPGVGSFGAGMVALDQTGLGAAIVDRIDRGAATLAICLGLQLLCRASDEAPGVPGLGVLPVAATRLPDAPRLPHFGWNAVAWETPATGATASPSGEAYFAHTYCLEDAAALRAAGWSVATTTEGSTFVSAVRRGAVLACQFHPELSGPFGVETLEGWLQGAAGTQVQGDEACAAGGSSW